MAPSAPAVFQWCSIETSLGLMVAARAPAGLCTLVFCQSVQGGLDDISARLRRRFGAHAQLEAVALPFLSDPLHLPAPAEWPVLHAGGTPFQQRVWTTLQQIPPGTTETYSSVAERLGAPHSVRAVAAACAANPVALLIPCHRVIAKNGNLGGYRWGIERKQAVLQLERARTSLQV